MPNQGSVFRNHPHYYDQPHYYADQSTAAIGGELAHSLLAQDRSWWRRYSRLYWYQPRYNADQGTLAIPDELSHPLQGQPPQNRATRAGDVEFKQKPLRFEDDTLSTTAISVELIQVQKGNPPQNRATRAGDIEFRQPVYRIDQSTSVGPDLALEQMHATPGQPPQLRSNRIPWLQPRYYDLNGLGLLGAELALELTQEPNATPQRRRPVLQFFVQPVTRVDQSTGGTPPDLELELTHTLQGQPVWRVKRYQPGPQTFPWLPDLEAELSFPRPVANPQRKPVLVYWHQPQGAQFTPQDLQVELSRLLTVPWRRRSLAYWLQPRYFDDQGDHTVIVLAGGDAAATVTFYRPSSSVASNTTTTGVQANTTSTTIDQ